MGGLKNDLITSAWVLFFNNSGMRANAVPASQKEQMRRYKEMNAYTLVSNFSSFLLEAKIGNIKIPERYSINPPFSLWPITESQDEL